MTTKPCPIYAVPGRQGVQVARRDDGVWFMRKRSLRGWWLKWEKCVGRPYEFSAFIDRRAGNARLPDAPESNVIKSD